MKLKEFPRTTTKIKNGYTITVTEMNEPSEEAILECRKAITKLINEKEPYSHMSEENRQSIEDKCSFCDDSKTN